MVKLLFSGSVDHQWDDFFQKLSEVQASAHGPFDSLFLVGHAVENEVEYQSIQTRLEELSPMIIYFLQYPPSIDISSSSEGNIKFLGPDKAGIINAHKNLTIAYAFGLNDQNYHANFTSVRNLTSNMSYRGCDALVTSSWPREAYQFLEGADMQDYLASDIGIGAGSRYAAELALLTRPRYHFVAGVGQFYQRVPYKNSATSQGQPTVYTRLISLCSTSSSKEKNKKWLHALNIQPIIYMKINELEEAPALYSTCPYAPIGESLAPSLAPPTKKPRYDNIPVPTSNAFFFDAGSQKSQVNLVAPSADAKTLFIGGLAKWTTDEELKHIMQSIVSIRRPVGKSYAFVEFSTHEAAEKTVEQGNRKGFNLSGKTLSVGWAGGEKKSDNVSSAAMSEDVIFATLMKERVLVPPTEDSKILYVGNLPSAKDEGSIVGGVEGELNKLFEGISNIQLVRNYGFVEFESYKQAMAALSSSLTRQIYVLGRPVVIGWSKHSSAQAAKAAHPPSADCRVLYVGHLPAHTSKEEITSLWSDVAVNEVRRPEGRDYAFLEFSSPDDAIYAMQSITSKIVILHEHQLTFGWAKGKPAAQSMESQECWFCMASPLFKAHLVVSIGQSNYLALPRGGINPYHVLICPIDCVPNRIHLSLAAKQELLRFTKALEVYYLSMNHKLLCFDRAVRTKSGRDHMQVQCVAIPHNKVSSSLKTFQSKAESQGLVFHEVGEGIGVEEMVLTMPGGPYQEYFYIEIPDEEDKRKRYVYVQEDESTVIFPMQFGIEVATTILDCPEKVHWKHCLLSEAQETEQTEKFRDAFTPYDFTLG